MKIAVEGCAHGELEIIYDCLLTLKEKSNIEVDLLICCGDFQSVRNNEDLCAMAVPAKYQNICSFYKYYSGEKVAPVLTLFIGGNHEASNYLQELPYGGWVAPNIYYLGRAGVIWFGNLRIGGLSGIFNSRHYFRGLWECPPYTDNSLRSVYHIRALDTFRLKQINEPLDIMLSHDWPLGITDYGNKAQLIRFKPFFKEEIEDQKLGSPPAEELLHKLKPDYWFSAHLHCQFAALVRHISEEKETKFLALDKCLPKRRHLQILSIEGKDGDKRLKHDLEWLAILRSTNHLLTVKDVDHYLPGPGDTERFEFTPTDEEKNHIATLFANNLEIAEDAFVKTAPDYVKNAPKVRPSDPRKNPQTVSLCTAIGIDDPVELILTRNGRQFRSNTTLADTTSNATLPVTSTPLKMSKMALPTPNTPIVQDFVDTDRLSQSICTDNASAVMSDSLALSDCLQKSELLENEDKSDTSSGSSKRSFKRRNESLYASNVDEIIEDSLNEVRSEETPQVAKAFKKRNSSLYTTNKLAI